MTAHELARQLLAMPDSPLLLRYIDGEYGDECDRNVETFWFEDGNIVLGEEKDRSVYTCTEKPPPPSDFALSLEEVRSFLPSLNEKIFDELLQCNSGIEGIRLLNLRAPFNFSRGQ